jgi:acyl carrier protein
MDAEKILAELRSMLVERLKFDARRAAETHLGTTLPKGVDGSLGLDSLDFIELSIAIEERFGITMDEREELEPHFQSLETLVRYIASRMARE